MELELTTNDNVVFLYPLSLARNQNYRSNGSTASNGTSASGGSQTSRSRSRRPTSLIITNGRRRSSSGGNTPILSNSPSGGDLTSYSNLNDQLEVDKLVQNPTAVLLVTVHLTVPPKVTPPKTLQSLVVTVYSVESLSFPKGRYEQGQPFVQKVVVEKAAGTSLASGGIYRWEIAVNIPHSAVPYERTRHGSVKQRVGAKLTFSGILNRALSVEKPLAFIAVPVKDSTEPLTWCRTHAAWTGHLGPFFVALRTQHLTVGGFLRAALVLHSPREGVKITSFTVKLVQQVKVKSRELQDVVESALPSEVGFLDASDVDLAITNGQSLETTWLVRVPDCNKIRPSTTSGSDAAVHIMHNIEVHISFLDKPFSFEKVNLDELDEQGRRLYHYRVSWFVMLPSCTLKWRSFLLPAYSQFDSDPVPDNLRFCDEEMGRLSDMKFCTCGEHIEKLISYECEAESDFLTSALMQEDIKKFRQFASRHIPSEQPISGGTSFGYESLEGQVLEETDEERKVRLQKEKETNEYSAVEDGVGEVILFQDFNSGERANGSSSKV